MIAQRCGWPATQLETTSSHLSCSSCSCLSSRARPDTHVVPHDRPPRDDAPRRVRGLPLPGRLQAAAGGGALAIGEPGAKNAAILALSIISLSNKSYLNKLEKWKTNLRDNVPLNPNE